MALRSRCVGGCGGVLMMRSTPVVTFIEGAYGSPGDLGSGPVSVAPGATIADQDSDEIKGVTVQIVAGAMTGDFGDTLSITGTPPEELTDELYVCPCATRTTHFHSMRKAYSLVRPCPQRVLKALCTPSRCPSGRVP